MFYVKKEQCSDADIIVSSLRSTEGLEVQHLDIKEWNEDGCLYFYSASESTVNSLRGLGTIMIRRRDVLIQECPSVAVTTAADNLPAQISAEAIASAVDTALDVKIVSHPATSSKSLFYCRPTDLNFLLAKSVRIDGKSHLISEPVLQRRQVASVPPPQGQHTPGVHFSIDIFHDSENCTCPASLAGLNAVKLYEEVVKGVLRSLPVGTVPPEMGVSGTKVNWHFFMCSSRQNEFNKPSVHFMKELQTLGATQIDCMDKPDAVDTTMQGHLRNYGDTFNDLKPDAKSKRVVVVISGDRDFSASVMDLKRKGVCVMLISNNESASEAYMSQGIRVGSGTWRDFIKASIAEGRYASPQPAPVLTPPLRHPAGDILANKRIVKLNFPQYNHILKYSKKIIDEALVKISKDVVMNVHVDKAENKPCLTLKYMANDEEEKISEKLSECTSCILGFLGLGGAGALSPLVTSAKVTVVAKKTDILGDEEFKELVKTHKVSINFFASQAVATDVITDPCLVVMEIPASWLPLQGVATVRGAGRGPYTSPIRQAPPRVEDRIEQYLENHYSISAGAYQCTVEKIRGKLYAKLKFRATHFASWLLDPTNTSGDVVFSKKIEDEAAATLSFTMTYQEGQEEGSKAVEARINQLSYMQVTEDLFSKDLFPKIPEPASEHRTSKEYFFFNIAWSYLMDNVKALAPGVDVVRVKDQNKTVLSLRGLKGEVDLALSYLRDRVSERNLKFLELYVKPELRKDYLKNALDILFKELQNPVHPVHGGKVLEVPASTPRIYPYITDKSINIIAFSERQAVWSVVKDEVTAFLKDNLLETIQSNGTYVDIKKIKKSFGLVYCKITNPGVIELCGISGRVRDAKIYIEQTISGGAPISVDLMCENEMITRYLLQLAGPRRQLAQLRDRVTSLPVKADGAAVTATIAGGDMADCCVLVLHGAERDMVTAKEFAEEGLRELTAGLTHDLWTELSVHELDWLRKSMGNFEDYAALVEFVNTSDADPSPVYDKGTKYISCLLGERISLAVACCSVLEMGNLYKCDVLVNSANSGLQHRGGIAKFISDEAGPGLADACATIDAVPVGKAVVTDSFGLSRHGFSHIVHAVAPKWPDATDRLSQCVRNALDIACSVGAQRVAIPGIGMGIYGWPKDKASADIVRTIAEWVAHMGSDDCSIKQIFLFDQNSDVSREFEKEVLRLGQSNEDPMLIYVPLGDTPSIPTHQWFWSVWEWEIKNHGDSVSQLMIDGKSYAVVAYDPDQVLLLEEGYAKMEMSPTITMNCDSHTLGRKVYEINFKEMTQTTVPPRNSFSCRRVFRIPVDSKEGRKCDSTRGVSSPKLSCEISYFPVPIPKGIAAARPGVSIFGPTDAIKDTKTKLQRILDADTQHLQVELRDLARTKIPFWTIFSQLKEALAPFHVNMTVCSECDWEIDIVCLGELQKVIVQGEVLRFEKRKVAEMLLIPLPPSWGCGDYVANGDAYPEPSLKQIEEGSDEYDIAAKIFFNNNFKADILKLERVQNVELYQCYQEKKKDIDRRNINGTTGANEMLLKHGTGSTDPRVIWNSSPSKTNTYGFDFRYSSENNFFGRGSYFCDNANYVSNSCGGRFAYSLGDGVKQMFIARVALGSCEEKTAIDKAVRAPSSGYQSIKGPISGDIDGFVVYELAQAYPEYLITYRDISVRPL